MTNQRKENSTCQCEHCREIIRQQNRLENWQKKKLSYLELRNTFWIGFLFKITSGILSACDLVTSRM